MPFGAGIGNTLLHLLTQVNMVGKSQLQASAVIGYFPQQRLIHDTPPSLNPSNPLLSGGLQNVVRLNCIFLAGTEFAKSSAIRPTTVPDGISH